MLLGHTHHQRLHLLGDAGSAARATLLAPVELLRDQTRVPAQEGLGGRDCRDLWQASTAKGIGERCQAMTCRVREAEPAATTLGFQDAVFREEIGDDLLLVTLEPASALFNHTACTCCRAYAMMPADHASLNAGAVA